MTEPRRFRARGFVPRMFPAAKQPESKSHRGLDNSAGSGHLNSPYIIHLESCQNQNPPTIVSKESKKMRPDRSIANPGGRSDGSNETVASMTLPVGLPGLRERPHSRRRHRVPGQARAT